MYMTIEEIELEYDGNWVFMVNCKWSKYHKIIGGEVAAASKDKEEIIEMWSKPDNNEPYFRYFGSLPEEVSSYLL